MYVLLRSATVIEEIETLNVWSAERFDPVSWRLVQREMLLYSGQESCGSTGRSTSVSRKRRAGCSSMIDEIGTVNVSWALVTFDDESPHRICTSFPAALRRYWEALGIKTLECFDVDPALPLAAQRSRKRREPTFDDVKVPFLPPNQFAISPLADRSFSFGRRYRLRAAQRFLLVEPGAPPIECPVGSSAVVAGVWTIVNPNRSVIVITRKVEPVAAPVAPPVAAPEAAAA
jgi:hypothetical protein